MSRCLLVLLLACLPVLPAGAQTLLFSTSADLTAVQPAVADQEILAFDPAGGSRVVLPSETLAVMVGDSNGNGLLDDVPTDIDACCAIGPLGGSDWLLSTTTTMSLPGSPSVKDGDVFRFNQLGQVEVQYPESFFASITGTSAIDVDAFAIDAAGTLYFSFAEDETSSAPQLIAENGGSAVIDEQVVLRFAPQDTFAHVHFSQSQVAGFFGQVLGSAFSTVVDTTGVAVDPQGQSGDLLITSGSTSAALRGVVVSSRNGGEAHLMGGQPVNPTLLGLGAAISLDALDLVASQPHFVLRALPSSGSSAAGGPASLALSGLQPGDAIQLVASGPILPAPAALAAPATTGFGAVYLDPAHALFAASFQFAAFVLQADAAGRAAFGFNWQGIQPGTAVVVQALRMSDLEISNPVAVNVEP